MRFLTVSALLVSLAACSGEDGNGEDGPCADPARSLAVPSPAWHHPDGLRPPEGDRAAGLLGEIRPAWLGELHGMPGWPRRPTLVVPLDGVASAVDAGRVRVFVRDAGEHAMAFEALLDGRSLVLKPEDPFPPGADRVVVVLEPGVAAGARALPVCGSSGGPHPAYREAQESLPDGVEAELALPVDLADASGELGNLRAELSARPVLVVDQVAASSLDSFGDRSPPPEVATHLAATAAKGILELPDYRAEGGIFSVRPDGVPEPAGTTRPGFVVALPAAGTPPHPFVLFQHGGTQDKADFFQLAGPLAEAGFAFVAIDLPYHGDRAPAGGGSDMDILDFESPLRTRDNLRQAAADHLAVLTGIEELNQALGPVLGIPRALDPDRAFYLGLSLGGVSGSLTFASAPQVRAAALFVGAGGYPEIVSFGFFSLMIHDVVEMEALEREVVLGLAEVLLDGADPLAYARHAEDRQAEPRPVLFHQAIDDPVIFMPASDRWARAFGADLARPAHHEVAGMRTLDLPAADNFSWVAEGPSATRLLVQSPMNEVPTSERHGGLIVQGYSQEMVAHCFATFLDSGSCEVIDTGFASH